MLGWHANLSGVPHLLGIVQCCKQLSHHVYTADLPQEDCLKAAACSADSYSGQQTEFYSSRSQSQHRQLSTKHPDPLNWLSKHVRQEEGVLVNLPGSEHRVSLVPTKVRTQPCLIILSNLPLTVSAACLKNIHSEMFPEGIASYPYTKSLHFPKSGPISLCSPLS